MGLHQSIRIQKKFGDSFVLIIIFGLILMSVEEPPTISALSLGK
jgi:hypothetical protein